MKNYSKALGIFASFLIALSYPLFKTYSSRHEHRPVFGLLIPNGSEQAIATRLWLKTAEEEGVPLEPINYDSFTDPFQSGEIESKAILVPDEVSQNASSTLIAYLEHYVSQGGKLILVGDALMHELNGRLKESFPAESLFEFPALVGRAGDTIQYQRDTLRITDEWIKKLQIPPGQYTPNESITAPFRDFSTYQNLHAQYPHWKTTGAVFDGIKILEAGDGSLVAGIHKMDLGEVLWINLPLSFLKRRTDGLLMHSMLRWISQDWLGLPRLLSVPDGVGGLVLNVHVDSNAALPYLTKLKQEGFFEDGPFSIHITAGPDTRETGDHLGFNLPGNKASQDWVKYWLKLGHEVGSHGGWIHDYFGLHVTETRTPEFENYLNENYDAIKNALGKGPVEYSAPLGNHPLWVNDWLREKGYHAYYFVGDNGMGPTQNFRDDQFTDKDLWSFPITSFLQVASFEEASEQNISQSQMTANLMALSHFVSENQNSRLFYFHPPGIQFYQRALLEWRQENKILAVTQGFKWYTMDRLASFLTQRSKVRWNLNALPAEHQFELRTEGCDNLHEMVFKFNKKSVLHLRLVSGKAKIRELAEGYEVQAESDQSFRLNYEDAITDAQ